ncbi:MAG: carbohydrate ABC transporter permease [Anaerolineaceae bacterium]|nr:carbohydrate ABC transporter permease [Anaerolineaceae bacterium]
MAPLTRRFSESVDLRRVQWVSHAILIVLLLLTIIPVLLLLLFSFKNNTQFFSQRFEITLPLYVNNYTRAWNADIGKYMLNSLLYTVGSVALTLVPASLSAYVFARLRFHGKEVLFYMVLGLLMIPGVLTLIPSFILIIDLKLLSTRWAFWLPYAAGGQAFAILVLRTSFAGLPEDLFESARVDGAREIRIFWSIVLPLSLPILGTLALLQANVIWNDLIWPLTINTNPELKPVMAGLMIFTGIFRTEYGPLFAGYVLASLPMIVLFAFTSRLFIRGLMSGAIRM